MVYFSTVLPMYPTQTATSSNPERLAQQRQAAWVLPGWAQVRDTSGGSMSSMPAYPTIGPRSRRGLERDGALAMTGAG